MISIAEALDLIAQQPVHLHEQALPLNEARGHYLARAIHAPLDLPSFDNSAMDGYAICGEGETFAVVGEVAAGSPTDLPLVAGEAMRIFTGGQVPAGTTAVVMQEQTTVEGSTLRVQAAVRPGQNIRRRGSELTTGQEVFAAGQYLSPAALGLIGGLGLDHVPVYCKPRIELITTGNELVPPGAPRGEGQIYEANSFALAAALQDHGFQSQGHIHLRDDYAATEQGLAEALSRSEVLIISGGISVGDYDYVQRALSANGVEEVFYKVFQKPGKPLYFGRKGDRFVFALPGNPASSLTGLYIHVLPLLQKLSGATRLGLPRRSVPLAEAYEMKQKRPSFLKARLGDEEVHILDGQGSSMLHSLALGNALVFLPEPRLYREGEEVTCVEV